jgi:hypothetical protein
MRLEVASVKVSGPRADSQVIEASEAGSQAGHLVPEAGPGGKLPENEVYQSTPAN